MTRTALLALTFLPALSFADLVAWFPLEGNAKEMVKGTCNGETKGDSMFGSMDRRLAAAFGGKNGAVLVPDSPQFALGPSFSISAQVWIRKNPVNGTSPAGQIVFRGDDRSGLDNYSLNLGNDGYFSFYINSAEGDGTGVRAPSRPGVWQTLLGTFDGNTRQITLYVDGVCVAHQYATFTPITVMDPNTSPGFAIGNVQNPFGGIHNQPFNGYIRDVRLYNTVVEWDTVTRPPKLLRLADEG